MSIKIKARLKPFSHHPGASCVIPGSCSIVEAFPTLLRIDGEDWKMDLTGPVEGFTLEQDLERNCVFVFGKAKEGYFRLKILAHDHGVEIKSEKGPLKSGKINKEMRKVETKEFERLSLGSHKSQCFDKHLGLKEILPILFCLGQKTPHIAPQKVTGTAALLTLPEEKKDLEKGLTAFLKAGFKSLLIPRLVDDHHHGFVPSIPAKGDPFFLLQEGAKMIRSLFFSQNERRIAILPNLPISFDAGRIVGLQAPGIGMIDIEWSKKLLKRVTIRANTSGEVILELQKEIKTFRVGKGKKLKKGEPLLLESGKTTHLDRFEK